MKVIILAGGKTNLPGKLKNIPKSLIEVKDRPLLEYQLDLLKKYKLDGDIRLSLQYKSEEILNYLKKKDPKADISKKQGKVAGMEYIVGAKPLGTGGAIRSAANGIKKDFLVINGDVLSNLNISDFINFYKKNISEPRFGILAPLVKISPTIFSLESSPIRKRVSYETNLGAMATFYAQDNSELGLVKTKNDKIIEFIEKPDYQYSGYINAGFYILSPEIFKTKIYKSQKTNQTFPIERIVFPEIAKNSQLLAYVHRGLWADIGSEEGLAKAEEIVDKLKNEEK